MPLEPTPLSTYLSRRAFFRKSKPFLTAAGFSALPLSPAALALDRNYLKELEALQCLQHSEYSTTLTPTPLKSIVGYNNYYEFSTDKKAVSILAQEMNIDNWTLECSGLIKNPATYSMTDIADLGLEDRTYRLRCVEGWSMVIPWCGIQLSKLIDLCQPTEKANYVRFIGAHQPSSMLGQRRDTMDWPYIEALRIDEARHPLTLLAQGLYGKALPKQNGAPIRLVVPWKYGFKSIKAITKIEFTEHQPTTSWNTLAPNEYGFYANVNPRVSHPRWSQRREVVIGEVKKQKTLMFNGYEPEVSHLYKNMNLEEHY